MDPRLFPIAVMGKTGTTNEFRDALFVGSTYGLDGITVAARIRFDDNRSHGAKETGGRLALPVFREVMLKVYRDRIVGPALRFPIRWGNASPTTCTPDDPVPIVATVAQSIVEPVPAPRHVPVAEYEWLKGHDWRSATRQGRGCTQPHTPPFSSLDLLARPHPGPALKPDADEPADTLARVKTEKAEPRKAKSTRRTHDSGPLWAVC